MNRYRNGIFEECELEKINYIGDIYIESGFGEFIINDLKNMTIKQNKSEFEIKCSTNFISKELFFPLFFDNNVFYLILHNRSAKTGEDISRLYHLNDATFEYNIDIKAGETTLIFKGTTISFTNNIIVFDKTNPKNFNIKLTEDAQRQLNYFKEKLKTI